MVLLILSAGLLIVSYKYPNIVVEVDSVVAFCAALVLIYKDSTHTVQLRLVDRMLASSSETISGLSRRAFIGSDFSYVSGGKNITDVAIVPRGSRTNNGNGAQSSATSIMSSGKNVITYENKPIIEEEKGIVPPGRSLAQLFLRELPMENPSLDDLIASVPQIFSQSFGLSQSSVMILKNKEDAETGEQYETVEFVISHPVLKDTCSTKQDQDGQSNASLSCIVCSLIATLICYTSMREVSVLECSRDLETDTAIIRFRLGAKTGKDIGE